MLYIFGNKITDYAVRLFNPQITQIIKVIKTFNEVNISNSFGIFLQHLIVT